MGLSFKLPDEFNNISEQEATEQEPSGEEEEAEDEEVDLEDLATFLNDTGFTGIDKTEDCPLMEMTLLQTWTTTMVANPCQTIQTTCLPILIPLPLVTSTHQILIFHPL